MNHFLPLRIHRCIFSEKAKIRLARCVHQREVSRRHAIRDAAGKNPYRHVCVCIYELLASIARNTRRRRYVTQVDQ